MKKLVDLPLDLLDDLVTRGHLGMREHRLLKEIHPDLPPNPHSAQRTIVKAWRARRARQATNELKRRCFMYSQHHDVDYNHISVEGLDRLLEAGADVHAAPLILHWAIYAVHRGGNPDLVRRLVAAGADPNAPDPKRWGTTPFHEAILFYAGMEAFEALLGAPGADVNVQDEKGTTPLYFASLFVSLRGMQEFFDALVAAGAELSSLDREAIARHPQPEMIDALVAAGVDFSFVTKARQEEQKNEDRRPVENPPATAL